MVAEGIPPSPEDTAVRACYGVLTIEMFRAVRGFGERAERRSWVSGETEPQRVCNHGPRFLPTDTVGTKGHRASASSGSLGLRF